MTNPTKTANPRRVDGNLIHQTFVHLNTTPHWLRYGNGSLNLDVRGNLLAKWVTLDTTETSWDTNRSKRTMLTLDEVGARALRDTLNVILGEGTP